MQIWNSNKLRISANLKAHIYGLSTHLRPSHYFSNDHARGRESNWSVVLGPLWVHVKYRPGGKSSW